MEEQCNDGKKTVFADFRNKPLHFEIFRILSVQVQVGRGRTGV